MRLVILSLVCLCGSLLAAPVERGLASWYGAPYDGQKSASGEIYDQEQLTAAHRTLPFGTRVRVRRLDRNRSVIVTIIDRGPFVESRIIDLSHAAAVLLGIEKAGVAPVSVEVVKAPRVLSLDLTPHRHTERTPTAPTVIAMRRTAADLTDR